MLFHPMYNESTMCFLEYIDDIGWNAECIELQLRLWQYNSDAFQTDHYGIHCPNAEFEQKAKFECML